VTAATVRHATSEELLETVLYIVCEPRLHNEDIAGCSYQATTSKVIEDFVRIIVRSRVCELPTAL
jgi:hypothetical protein